MLEELRGDVLVRRVLTCQLEGDEEHRAAEERHPRRAVRLLEVAARGEWLRPIEDPDVVQAQEPAPKEVVALRVLAVHPPREVDEQLVEHALEEAPIAVPSWPRHLVDAITRPRVHGRIHVVKRE